MSRGWQGGSTRAHRQLRADVLRGAGYRCQAHPVWCDQAGAKPHQCTTYAPYGGGPGVAGHLHHTLGKKVTGDDPRYVVAACPACNLAIGEPRPDTDPPPRPRSRW